MAEKLHLSEDWLRARYFGDGMSVPEMAEISGVSHQSVYDSMDRRGIDRDATRYGHKRRVEYATYYTDDQGYPRWQSKTRVEEGRRTHNFHVHRLLAIAEHGVDAVVGSDVHHVNGIPWDNRPSNIEILEHGEHRSRHMTPSVVDKMCRSRGDSVPVRGDDQ